MKAGHPNRAIVTAIIHSTPAFQLDRLHVGPGLNQCLDECDAMLKMVHGAVKEKKIPCLIYLQCKNSLLYKRVVSALLFEPVHAHVP